MDTEWFIDQLTRLFTIEQARRVRDATRTAIRSGPYAHIAATRLKESGAPESPRAGALGARTRVLDGTLTADATDNANASSLEEMLRLSLEREKETMRLYVEILERVPIRNATLVNTIEDILRNQQTHLEKLHMLRPPRSL